MNERRTDDTAMVRPASPPRVVLLEDDRNDAFFVQRAFERAHIANPVVAFASAEAARRDVGASGAPRPALFVLDINLAGGESGLTFLRWLRRQPIPLGSTPAMMLTGSVSPVDQNEAEMLGSTCFLSKPVTEETLTAAVQTLGCVVTRLSDDVTQLGLERP